MRAIGPTCHQADVIGAKWPVNGMRPWVALRPAIPVNAAGPLTEIATSLPIPSGDIPAAMAAESPPDDPPGVRSTFQGLLVRPVTRLSVSVADAERLKTVYGSVLPGQADEREMISIVPVGAGADEAPGMIPRSHLTRILRPRVEEILVAIRDRMQATGMMDVCGRRFVLTGGGSELTGLPEVARRVLARNVRNGRPMGIAGLPEIARGAAFASIAGMLIYPQVCAQEFVEPRATARLTGTDGYFARVGSWLRASF